MFLSFLLQTLGTLFMYFQAIYIGNNFTKKLKQVN